LHVDLANVKHALLTARPFLLVVITHLLN